MYILEHYITSSEESCHDYVIRKKIKVTAIQQNNAVPEKE